MTSVIPDKTFSVRTSRVVARSDGTGLVQFMYEIDGSVVVRPMAVLTMLTMSHRSQALLSDRGSFPSNEAEKHALNSMLDASVEEREKLLLFAREHAGDAMISIKVKTRAMATMHLDENSLIERLELELQ